MWELGGTEKVVCVQPEQGQGSENGRLNEGTARRDSWGPGDWETVAGVEGGRWPLLHGGDGGCVSGVFGGFPIETHGEQRPRWISETPTLAYGCQCQWAGKC